MPTILKAKTATPDQFIWTTKYSKHPVFTTPALYQPNIMFLVLIGKKKKKPAEDLLR